jgi:multicomponent Na+:H+ antiporter subunit B
MTRKSIELSQQSLLRLIAKMLIPFILVFGLYVILHGELGPGGGFQGGVILAAAFILYGLVFGADELRKRVPPVVFDVGMALGALIYAGTGLACLFFGGTFLDYGMLQASHAGGGEALGMTLVEYGVGITVCSVMLTIYLIIGERRAAIRKGEQV